MNVRKFLILQCQMLERHEMIYVCGYDMGTALTLNECTD